LPLRAPSAIRASRASIRLPGLDHVEVKAQLHQANFMMVGSMRAYRKRQSMAINYRHDFHAFSPLRCADLVTMLVT
jgi:hypothetical protein